MGKIKSTKEIIKMQAAGHVVGLVHQELKKMIKPGITTLELDAKAKEIILSNGATPTFLGFGGFPNSICTSVNNTLVHGIPNDHPLVEGDIISIDVGATLNGFVGDAAFTMGVGEIDKNAKKVLDVSKDALALGIKMIKPGLHLGDLGFAIEHLIKKAGLTSTHQYTGHFIGKQMHESPAVPNFGIPGQGLVLKEGMTFCIEPMVIDGRDQLFTDPLDNWTVRTVHGGITAHDEHTVLVTATGGEILTK